MSQPNVRALTRNTYSLDTAGVLAHLRDTTRAYASRIVAIGTSRPIGDRETASLPRARVGPADRALARHTITDTWRIR